MPKSQSNFVCQQCGYVSPSFLGRCPNCQAWNSLVETFQQASGQARNDRSIGKPGEAKPIKLSEIKGETLQRVSTGMSELDRVLGGGIVPGMAVLVAGEPGIGKSTLLLELARNWGKTGAKESQKAHESPVLYIAGEESASQIKIRSERLHVVTGNVLILEATDVDEIISQISLISQIGLIIVDSIQTLTTTDLTGPAGSVGQVRECAARLIGACKQLNIPLFLVGHVTKDGTIAGPKVLEHIVDTILTVEGDRYEGLRIIRTSKNRFGPTDEVGVFQMTDAGLKPITDYNGLFTDITYTDKPGSCLTVTLEGTRPILVEIQALATSTPLPTPRRVASGVDYNRLQTTVAILQKRLSIPLYKEDIYVSVAGGLKIEEPAIDLPMALAIMSSFHNKPLPKSTLAIGELDLLGNIRRVNNLEKRIKEAKSLGFKNIISPETHRSIINFKF